MKRITTLFAIAAGILFPASAAFSHCQIPCGIYADDNVFVELMTDVDTIEKSMKQIISIGDDAEKNWNQLVRWVNNKEDHAQNIQDRMSAYFLAQRIQLAWKESEPERYTKLVELAHKITVLAMKCKQTTDLANAHKLGEAIHDFQHLYAGK